jgi:hypothetical protein
MATTETVQISALDSAIKKILDEYGDDVRDCVSETIEDVAKETKKIIKENAQKKTGAYRSAITSKKTKNGVDDVCITIHAGKKASLAHLLENGHGYHNSSTRYAGKEHWGIGQRYVEQNFESELRKKIEKL